MCVGGRVCFTNAKTVANLITIKYTVQPNLATKPEGHLKHLDNQEFRFNLSPRKQSRKGRPQKCI